MDHLLKIARTATPDSGTQFRSHAYGDEGVRDFLRDVLALANASVEGNRYLVVGVDFDADFAGKPSYQSLANEYIEPSVRIRYKPVSIDGTRVGVFEIGDCQDRPYMMRADFDETLRRGDAYKRINDAAVKLGRRQLMELFERKFRDSVSAGDIEIGFPGEIIHKEITFSTCDLSQMPSALASHKLEEMLQIRKMSRSSGSTTMVARLTHARLYGTEDPYVDRSPDDIMSELAEIRQKYRHQDNNFLFNERAQELQLVVYNQGEEQINDAFGDIPAGEPVEAFSIPLRLCAGKDLVSRRFGIRYALHGQNLRAPATGQLKMDVKRGQALQSSLSR